MRNLNDYEIWFASINISAGIKIKLLKEYNSAEDIWSAFLAGKDMRDQKASILEKMKQAWEKDKIGYIRKTIDDKGINTVIYSDDDYPVKLKFIEDPPYVLYYYGDIKKLSNKPAAAIVGARNATWYGRDCAKFISKELASRGVTIISGMARGIDTASHESSLENDNYTCAILGSGIDVIYPPENKMLFKKICEKGCAASEFLPGTKPLAHNFPIRNRIVSGLSDITIVIEAGSRSGSLITASAALEQGKDVIAVPGSIFSKSSTGTNKLIKDGAYIFTEMQDIYDLLKIESEISRTTESEEASEGELEKNIYSLITDNPIHIDDIIRISNIDIQPLYRVLFEMQLRNRIRCISGSFYVKVNNSMTI